MKELLAWAYSKKFDEKTDKSFLNIINGLKTHQTYFDAVIQGLLPFFSYDDSMSEIPAEKVTAQKTLYPYFYQSTQWTFSALALLTQVVSAKRHGIKDYLPVTNQHFIQRKVKDVYKLYENSQQSFEQDLKELFDGITDPVSYLLLPRYDGAAFPLDLGNKELQSKLFMEKNHLTHQIAKHSILQHLYIRMPLHSATEKTLHCLKYMDIDELAAHFHVKRPTIEDHITEILIKDYPIDIFKYVTTEELAEISALRKQFHFQKLKPYYEHSEIKDYFKIKLSLIQSTKEP